MDPRRMDRGIWGQKTVRLSLKSLHLINFNLTNLEVFKLIRMAPELENLILEDCALPEKIELHSALGRSVLKRQDDIVTLKLLVQTSGDGAGSPVTFDEEYLMELKEAGLIL